MPAGEGQLQSSSRPAMTDRRSSSSRIHQQTDVSSNSTATNSPPSTTTHKTKSTARAHVVGGRLHKRVPSYGTNLHKHHPKPHTATEAHHSSKAPRRPPSPGPSISPPTENMPHVSSDTQLPRNGSTTSLKKNSSHVSLKRNRSTAEINKRPKSSSGLKRTLSQPGLKKKDLRRATVNFDIGNDANDDGWTEASNSASPSLSRTNSVGRQSSGQNSARPHASANISEAPTPGDSPHRSSDHSHQTHHHRTITPDARQITDRLLQRTPSHSAAPQMSSIIATATATTGSPDPFGQSAATAPGTPANSGGKDEITSRFVGSSAGTPTAGDNSPLLATRAIDRNDAKGELTSAKRIKSMGNLTRPDSNFDSDEERALAPRARQGSTTSTYNPNIQSRTQQKLWLQRASSNIEPQSGIPNGNTLVGAVYEGRDPRVRVQLERTGLEYLVVRRYQDPVGMAIRRLPYLPGVDKSRLIPPQKGHQRNGSIGAGKHGLSQSLRENKTTKSSAASVKTNGARSSYEASQQDSESDKEEDDVVEALLRRLWDKNLLEAGSVE